MKIDQYKLVLEISTLDDTIKITDLNTKIAAIEATELEEYRLSYNGESICSGSFYDDFVSYVFDGDVYQIDLTDQTSFNDIVVQILGVINTNLSYMESESKKLTRYRDMCTNILSATKSVEQDQV